MLKAFYFLVYSLLSVTAIAQEVGSITGLVRSAQGPVAAASISVGQLRTGASTDTTGRFVVSGVPAGTYEVTATAVGYRQGTQWVTITKGTTAESEFILSPDMSALGEVVVSGTLKEVNRLDSPVPVEVYSPVFFRKNPTPSIFDALQNINGVRPQLNCNVCNTGDIHINGLEGPYTMILIDGMPIVSGLASVYGLSGIPNSLVERVEIVKGPASSLYGSEAVGGLINVITKKPQHAPRFSADIFVTTWEEINADAGLRLNIGKSSALTGVSYFTFANPVDKNRDNFTDLTQQERISLFQKWNFNRKHGRLFSIAGRFNYEDRWGGDVGWDRSFRGGTDRYGESIYTRRWELLGNYQLPLQEKVSLSFSVNDHDQNSVYGSTYYLARQKVAFSQLTWDAVRGRHNFLAGGALRFSVYDDNTPVTAARNESINHPEKVYLPGLFFQDELLLAEKHKILLGMRYDYHSIHGNIFTPRVAYKWTVNERNVIRLNAGTGFRVVSLFTEEHAVLTGARDVVIMEQLRPETSLNTNLNLVKKLYHGDGSISVLDISAWYTRFKNQINPDYDTHPDQIIYRNLSGHAVSRGVSFNADIVLVNGLKLLAGGTWLDVFSRKKGAEYKIRPLLSEKWTGTWSVSYPVRRWNLSFDYTGNIYGPMMLPRLGRSDPRSEFSPVWSIQNVQMTFNGLKKVELYVGVKNLLNWTPGKNEPFLIARAHDPFDKHVEYDTTGNVMASKENPYALTFDPGFVYAPNQGIRAFAGMRMNIR